MGGKAEKGTPKYIANKIKAKGLQKLRWYCQMCQKQCRDENGFKCHTMSESHQRQLLLFADNANKYIDDFSREFSDGYIELLRRQFGTKRVNANKVYQEYISHRDHLHMNATQWETLTEFVKWLGREGKCVVDETEKGWFVAYIDRDPAAVAALEAKAKKEKMDKDDQERILEFIQKQVERGKKEGSSTEQPSYSEFKRENSQERVTLSLNLKRKPDDKKAEPLQSISMKLKGKDIKDNMSTTSKKSRVDEGKNRTALEEVMEMQERAKEKANRKDYWLASGIVVKIVTKSLGDKFYKKKATIERVIDKYGAEVKLVDSNTKLKLDQNMSNSSVLAREEQLSPSPELQNAQDPLAGWSEMFPPWVVEPQESPLQLKFRNAQNTRKRKIKKRSFLKHFHNPQQSFVVKSAPAKGRRLIKIEIIDLEHEAAASGDDDATLSRTRRPNYGRD